MLGHLVALTDISSHLLGDAVGISLSIVEEMGHLDVALRHVILPLVCFKGEDEVFGFVDSLIGLFIDPEGALP